MEWAGGLALLGTVIYAAWFLAHSATRRDREGHELDRDIRAWREKRDDESGFTLVELMVVVGVIGLLIVLAVPTFLKARDRAADRVAQARLTQSLTVADIYFTDDSSYVGFTPAQALIEEPGITWAASAAATAPNTVYLNTVSATTFEATTKSDSGAIYCVLKDTGTGVQHGTQDGNAAACSGSAW